MEATKRKALALARARRGAAFLDKKLGSKSWRRKIKRTKLDMSKGNLSPSGCGCILAQLGGSYLTESTRLGLTYSNRIRFGFTDRDQLSGAWGDLTEAWKQVIREGL